MRDTLPLLDKISFPALTRGKLDTLQINVGYRCNQTCFHCHVNAGPNRTEEMAADVAELVLDFIKRREIAHARHHRRRAGTERQFPPHGDGRARARRQGDGPLQPHHSGTAGPGRSRASFWRPTEVEVVASMPCYLEDNVEAQRGKGVFDESIRGLQTLNALGYGRDPELP